MNLDTPRSAESGRIPFRGCNADMRDRLGSSRLAGPGKSIWTKCSRTVRLVPILSLPLVLGACTALNWFTGGTDNSEPPTELVPLESPLGVQTLWQVGSGADSREASVRLVPALSDQGLYVAGFNGKVVAMNPSTGARRWTFDADSALSGGVGLGDDLVLVGKPAGEVIAIDTESGAEKWRAQVSSEVLSPPQAEGGVAVVRTVDGKLQGLDAADGAARWTYSTGVPPLTLRGTSAPVLVPGAVIAGLDNGKVAVIDTASGRAFWERTVSPPTGRTELERLVDIDANPKLVGKVMYLVTFQGRLVAMEVESGRILWSRDMSSYSGLDVDASTVFVSDADGAVWAMDRRSGASLWRQDALKFRDITRPVVFGDYVVIGDLDGFLHWLSRENGQIRARTRVAKAAIVVSPVSNGDTLFAMDVAGQVAAFRGP